METRNGNSRATLGDLHNNKTRILDLNTTREQLITARQQASDEKNAKEEYRTILEQVNRMVGGAGWTDPAEVKAAVQRKLDQFSNGRMHELEQSLASQKTVEDQLRAGLMHEQKVAKQSAETAGKLRETRDHVQREYDKLKQKFDAQQTELDRMGRMAVVPAAPAATPVTDEERESLLGVIEMEREDHLRVLREILQAAADAVAAVRGGLLSDKNSARGIKAQNQGLLYGSSAVEAAIGRVIHGIQPKEPIERSNG